MLALAKSDFEKWLNVLVENKSFMKPDIDVNIKKLCGTFKKIRDLIRIKKLTICKEGKEEEKAQKKNEKEKEKKK